MSSNEYMRQYMKRRYDERVAKAHEILGGKCVKCNSIDNLQIDHKVPKDKKFTLTDFTSRKWSVFYEELKKCQLLCQKCHNIKTVSENGKKIAKGTHGTLSSGKYCKCILCKKAKADYMHEWHKKNRAVSKAVTALAS